MARSSREGVPEELVTTSALVKATITALVVAALILMTVVLPAEYGIDPLGTAEPLGLSCRV